MKKVTAFLILFLFYVFNFSKVLGEERKELKKLVELKEVHEVYTKDEVSYENETEIPVPDNCVLFEDANALSIKINNFEIIVNRKPIERESYTPLDENYILYVRTSEKNYFSFKFKVYTNQRNQRFAIKVNSVDYNKKEIVCSRIYENEEKA